MTATRPPTAIERVEKQLQRDDFMQALAQSLPKKAVQPERFVRAVLSVVYQTPQLADCAQETIWLSALQAAQLGLWPGPLGHCYLIPRKNKKRGYRLEANFQLGYKGMIVLALRSPSVNSIRGAVVREGDDFDWRDGTRAYIDHRPKGDPTKPMTHAWSLADIRRGKPVFTVLTKDQVMARKARSDAANAGFSPWTTDPEPMWIKSAIRAMSNYLPLSEEAPESAEAMVVDQRVDEGLQDYWTPKSFGFSGFEGLTSSMGQEQTNPPAGDDRPAPPAQESEWPPEAKARFEKLLESIPPDKRPSKTTENALRDAPAEGALKALEAHMRRVGAMPTPQVQTPEPNPEGGKGPVLDDADREAAQREAEHVSPDPALGSPEDQQAPETAAQTRHVRQEAQRNRRRRGEGPDQPSLIE